ncbi:MAG: DUF3016 domain-containing protein [Verrucomicrobia bacterium]|nr:DUF3016 domain-containing protein [Verrucomicrobiota bacterium]
MKIFDTMIRFRMVSLCLASAVSLSADVVLNFGDPKGFTDFEYAQTRRTISTEFFANEVIVYLERAVEKVFPEGVVLTLDFQDIDLAGGFEPWQFIPLNDVRFYKSRYPPKAMFTYRLEDGEGNVLAEGDEALREPSYQERFSRRTGVTEPFYYERRMLERWIKSNLPKEVKKAEG